MNVIAEFHLGGPDLLLAEALAAVPDLWVELEQHTAGKDGNPIFFFWAEGEGFPEFEEAMAGDGTVADFDLLDEEAERRLYRVSFTNACFYDGYREASGKFLALLGTHRGWDIRMRFPGREEFLIFRRHVASEELRFRLDRLYRESELEIEESAMTPVWERDLGLTASQHETLLAALERGYYEEPRDTDLEGLAAEFDVSVQAIAGRLRRGHRNLIENTLRDEVEGSTPRKRH